jgi:hypothetical protein
MQIQAYMWSHQQTTKPKALFCVKEYCKPAVAPNSTSYFVGQAIAEDAIGSTDLRPR